MKKFPSHVTRDSGGGPVSPSRVTRESSWVTALDMRGSGFGGQFRVYYVGLVCKQIFGSLAHACRLLLVFESSYAHLSRFSSAYACGLPLVFGPSYAHLSGFEVSFFSPESLSRDPHAPCALTRPAEGWVARRDDGGDTIEVGGCRGDGWDDGDHIWP
jgi:hypothetical protein